MGRTKEDKIVKEMTGLEYVCPFGKDDVFDQPRITVPFSVLRALLWRHDMMRQQLIELGFGPKAEDEIAEDDMIMKCLSVADFTQELVEVGEDEFRETHELDRELAGLAPYEGEDNE